MIIFGADERGVRIGAIVKAAICFLIFLRILRGLLDDRTVLLAGLMFAIFPITGYFGVRAWLTPVYLLGFLAIWCYLVTIGSLKNAPEPKPIHKWTLAISLFLILQMRWEGFFYALAIGVHYVFRCIKRRRLPEKTLLTILIAAPLSSLILNFTIMAAGHGWEWQKIWALYQWRASKGEMADVMPVFDWGMWLARMWEFGLTNFTLPVLIIAIGYLTVGQLFVFSRPGSRRFPQFWLFLMPAVFQLFILRGCLWKHQYWEFPLVPFIAIAAALAIMLIADLLAGINRRLSVIVVTLLVTVVSTSCMAGLNHYYNIRWQRPMKIKMFEELNSKIPADKALLSFEEFVVDQHSVKGPHYRPEIAWYLDREIVVARSIEAVERKAKTGRYPYYLIPSAKELMPLINQLTRRYKYQTVPGQSGERTKDGRNLKVGMMTYMIFDLNSPPSI